MSSLGLESRFLGPIKLSPGVAPRQIFIFLFVIITAYCMLGFMPLMQAYVFTEMLHLPKGEQGRLAGNLTTVQQIAVLIFISVTGAMADRIGRRTVLIMALVGYSFCLIVYPLAPAISALFAIQFLFGLSSTGHTAGAATMMIDYPDNASRGKFIALMIVIQAIANAVLVGWLGARVPSWLVKSGIDADLAGRYAFWVLAAFGICGALVASRYLRSVHRVRDRVDALLTGVPDGIRAFRSNAAAIYRHARVNPRFGLVLMMGLVTRSDYFVVLSFVSLWVVQSAVKQGVGSADALKHAGVLSSVFQISTLVAPLVFGWLADRINRSALLVASLFLTGLALISTFFISDTFGVGMYVVIAAIGITESALIVGSQSVLGQEAPPELRGATIGIFALLGSFSVVIVSFVSGFLFDKIGYAAPFFMVGGLNLMFGLIGALIVRRDRGDSDGPLPVPGAV